MYIHRHHVKETSEVGEIPSHIEAVFFSYNDGYTNIYLKYTERRLSSMLKSPEFACWFHSITDTVVWSSEVEQKWLCTSVTRQPCTTSVAIFKKTLFNGMTNKFPSQWVQWNKNIYAMFTFKWMFYNNCPFHYHKLSTKKVTKIIRSTVIK